LNHLEHIVRKAIEEGRDPYRAWADYRGITRLQAKHDVELLMTNSKFVATIKPPLKERKQ